MNRQSYSPLYGRLLFGSQMVVFALFAVAALIGGVFCGSQRVAASDRPGVVRGVLYSPPDSAAIVDQKVVHEGQIIDDVVVVAIQSDAVRFSKGSISWQQKVLEAPHEVWER